MCDETGVATRLIGAAYDSTAVQDGEARVARILEAMPTAFYSVDRDWRFTYVNAEAERLLGSSREDAGRRSALGAVPGSGRQRVRDELPGGRGERRAGAFDAYYPEPLERVVRGAGVAEPGGAVGLLRRHHRAPRGAGRAASAPRTRSALLARLTTELTATLDASEGVGRLAEHGRPGARRLVRGDAGRRRRAPRLAPTAQGRRQLARDPELRGLVERYAETRVPALTDGLARRPCPRDRQAGASRCTTPPRCSSGCWSPVRPGTCCMQLNPSAVAVHPLMGRGRIVGLLTACARAGAGPLHAVPTWTCSTRWRRVPGSPSTTRGSSSSSGTWPRGCSARCSPRRRSPTGCSVAVRYEPAAQVAQVGGDWYDSFLQRDGATVVVIGDVVGHDTAAAAAMGQVRSLLRAIAAHTGDGPADVLRGVDRAMETLGTDTTATAVVARLEQNERRADPRRHPRCGGPTPGTRRRWSSTRQGDVVELGDGRVRPAAGSRPRPRRVESVVTLDRGATVLLYTDGLVERRGQSLDEGSGGCATVARGLAGRGAVPRADVRARARAGCFPSGPTTTSRWSPYACC